jgi:hypothetical protein
MLNGHKSILKLSMIILTFTSVLRLGWIEKGLTAIIAPKSSKIDIFLNMTLTPP